jgi:hypothetical protein
MKQELSPLMKKAWLSTNQRGFSLVEAILASAVFVLLVTALVGTYLYGEEATQLAGNRARAALLAQEALEAIGNIRDFAWNELLFSQSAVSVSGSEWILDGEGSSETIDNFIRSIAFSNPCRDDNDVIVPCPGSYSDVHTLKASSTVSWQQNPQRSGLVTLVTYLSNWISRNWVQTNWSGGFGQSIWFDETKYETDDSDLNISVAGQITLALAAEAWVSAAGTEFLDTTDADFNAGTHSNTQTTGSGNDASVVLTQSPLWVEHEDSGFTSNNLFDLDVVSGTDIWGVGANGTIAHYDGVDWIEFVNMGSFNINGIDMVTASDGWAVGNSGKIYQYNGAVWSEFVDLGAVAINDIEMLSATSGWAVGASAKIYFYNGATWEESIDFGAPDINGIDMVTASDGWAVGNSGKIYQYNGAVWSEFVDFVGANFNAVAMVSASDGWAVGNGGDIYRWNGSVWASVASPVSENLDGVFMVSATDGWAVGDSGKILHWNGIVWSETIDIGGTALNAVAFVNATSGWVLGNGGMVQQYLNSYESSGIFTSQVFDSGDTATVWSSIFWTETLPSGGDVTLATRTGNTPTPDVSWSLFTAERTDSLGEDITSPDGRYIQYRATFTRGPSPLATPKVDDVAILYNAVTTQNINDLSVISASNIWAVGNTGTIFTYNGSTWSEHADSGLISQDINGIDMVSASDGWAVGASEKFLHYNGANWSEFADLGLTSINAIDMISATDGWAVGNSSKFYHYDGIAWSEFVDLGSENVFDVFMVSAIEGWAVGASGKIYQYDGAAWTEFIDMGSANIRGIDMVSATDGWAVGASGKFYYYDGITWVEFIDTGGIQFNDVSMVSTAEGWAVGNSGNLYKFNGATWLSQSSPTNKDMQAVHMLSNLDGWAVGNRGTILHFFKDGVYEKQGLLTSSAFNAGGLVKIQVAEWDETISSCSPSCLVRLQVRAAQDSGGLPGAWTLWYGPAGANTHFTIASGTLIPLALNDNQWIQYRVELIGDGTDTPVVSEIRVNYK